VGEIENVNKEEKKSRAIEFDLGGTQTLEGFSSESLREDSKASGSMRNSKAKEGGCGGCQQVQEWNRRREGNGNEQVKTSGTSNG